MRRLCAQMANRGGPSYILLAAALFHMRAPRLPLYPSPPYPPAPFSRTPSHTYFTIFLSHFLIPISTALLSGVCTRCAPSRPFSLRSLSLRSDCIFIFSTSPTLSLSLLSLLPLPLPQFPRSPATFLPGRHLRFFLFQAFLPGINAYRTDVAAKSLLLSEA